MLLAFSLSISAGVTLSQAASFATTIFLHRCKTHRSLSLHPKIDLLFRVVLWFTTGQITKEWVAVHRKHHAHSDQEDDPHSPEQKGFWAIQLGNFLHYRKDAKNSETIRVYASDVLDDKWDAHVFNHGWAGPIIGTLVLCLLSSVFFSPWWGLLAALVHLLLYVGVLTSCVNAIGHYKVRTGYQNFTREDAAKTYNYQWLAYVTAGEGLHNNHHGLPGNAFLSHKKHEIDPAKRIILLLQRYNLAWGIKDQSRG